MLVVMLSLPFGLAGALFFTRITGTSNNIYTQISLIMLIGLLAKNAILIVEFAHAARLKGLSIGKAALRGEQQRLRPILMTSFAFVFGLIPLAIAAGAGAVGNNSTGVTGVNWNVKLMTIKNTQGIDEANVLEAYGYAFTMRKLYNETNGQKGAFVVVANSSWGLNFADPDDSPAWCAFYDTLGSVGIVSCAATTNLDLNVDIDGDMPTTCSSDYLIAVTRSGKNQETGGGYGPVNIDLAAPGINVFNIKKNAGYGLQTGTSLSSPLVAGMVAFLYSIPGNQLTTLAKADPAAAALLAKGYILNGVTHINSYSTRVASSGIANLFGIEYALLTKVNREKVVFASFKDRLLYVGRGSSKTAKLLWLVNA